jgi:hypothetical protein
MRTHDVLLVTMEPTAGGAGAERGRK